MASSLRVLHITTEFPPFVVGGLGTALGGLASASARARADVGVLLIIDELLAKVVERVERSTDGRRVPVDGAGHADLAADDDGDAASVAPAITLFQIYDSDPPEVAARIAMEWKPDVIHLHVVWVLPFLRSILERVRVPVVYTVHCLLRAAFDIGREPAHILEYSGQQKTTIGLARRVIALTHNEAALTGGYYPEARERIRVVGNGIDDSQTARYAARRKKPDESLLALYAGRLVERKGVRDLLDAIPLVLDSSPDMRFVFAGGPVNTSAEELEQAWLPASCAPFRNRISFTGWLSMEQLVEWYRAADMLVVPSRYEPFGMVILEGMLHGLPIAAANVGGPREILEHERTGLLFPPGDVEAIAQALLRLVTSAEASPESGRGSGARGSRKVALAAHHRAGT